MLDFEDEKAQDMTLEDIFWLLRAAANCFSLEGLSLLGGEPFHQAPAAGILAGVAQRLGLSVVVFTGYTLDVLNADPAAALLLSHTDLLIAGPYVSSARSVERPWIGSANQRVHLLTDRYRDHPDLAARHAQSVHVRLQDGELSVSGWPGVVEAVKKGASSADDSDRDES
jgi:anaerobic ribonucleoside-triphosphate reductase activating protein